ncbi:MAG: decarboxylating 6-phosphogluconate dehydrogenase [Candidatus Roizmanbacteria bacterium]|nr:decarboxylating 6-phosphogluconate dehydrogenase [Candidatus Roizmanbacteria bacterium]
MNKEIGIIGLGKMGKGIAAQLAEKGWTVRAYNRTVEKAQELASQHDSMTAYETVESMIAGILSSPRIVWVMVPAGGAVDETLFGERGVAQYLSEGDIVIDAGNSQYKNDAMRAQKLAEKGIQFVDAGVSGGPAGARNGACIMVGGPKALFEELEQLYKDLTVENGYAHFEGIGAGHFVKMVHNGIEYGMMQAIGEGFNVMKQSDFNLDLAEVARVYNRASVVESRLIGWLEKAYKEWGVELEPISGSISHSGEGKWTVEVAEEMGQEVPIIKESYEFRVQSQDNPSYVGKVVSALRGQFGGHKVSK